MKALTFAFCLFACAAFALAEPPGSKPKLPDPKLKPEKVISAEPGVKTYQASVSKMNDREFSVIVPKSYSHETPHPLVVSAYGNGSSQEQAKYWEELADRYEFIVVCPDYKCTEGCKNGAAANFLQEIRNDEKLLKEVVDRIFRSLNVDKRYVMHASYGTGGFPAFYVALGQPKLFTCAAVNSSFYWGEKCYGTKFFVLGKPSPGVWDDQPVYLTWEKGDPDIDTNDEYGKAEGPEELKFFSETLRCKKLKHEILKRGEGKFPYMAAKWFADEVVGSGGGKAKEADAAK